MTVLGEKIMVSFVLVISRKKCLNIFRNATLKYDFVDAVILFQNSQEYNVKDYCRIYHENSQENV